MKSYKLFFNESYLLITSDSKFSEVDFAKVITDEEAVFEFRVNPLVLFDSNFKGNILLVTPHVEETFESLFDTAEGIVAAGGVVKNDKGELLLIYRRGYWDLPKGKVEKGEKIINAAKREVEEETGVRVEEITTEPFLTYHCYTLKGKQCIKETHWYDMVAQPKQGDLVPQLEEDIEVAAWVKPTDLKQYKTTAYPLIWEILSRYL